ncbi:MAG: sulfite exporter TauE/SafE family protein [Bacteriovoracaceae bacterium]
MDYAIIGIIIGFVMGLTGSGGALVAIPLFISILSLSLKEASVFSLIAVSLASFINFLDQRKSADLKLAGFIFVGSILGSFAFKPVKERSPEIVLSVLLGLISLYALYSVWRKKKLLGHEKADFNFLKTFVLGFLLGGLTTMTGLGGGVLLMPIFLSFFYLSENRAVATSLLTISVSSLFSLLIQYRDIQLAPSLTQLSLLVAGMLVAIFILKLMLNKVKTEKMSLVRKILFSLVVVYAFSKIF